ncbi:MAG: formylglycine-generating enzyme family protein, partial [Muribaculaceae bacterium]|nr:formylglycine-generating enzyme family protein [Muribaculaceae bacterium]
ERPVEKVSWNACQAFIAKLNQMTGKNFRLPTEAEWEYAARGGNLSQGYKYPGSNDVNEVAWFRDNSYAVGSSSPDYGTHPVGTLAPNELGIYDMSGNVSEWCQDLYGTYTSAAQTNPTGSTSGSHRVYRGGSWGVNARYCRVSYRLNYTPTGISSNYGLRLVLDDENSPKFRLSETVVEIEVGGMATVDILNGSGSYSVDGGASIVTAAIDGETVMVTGITLGTNTVLVTDNATGATTVLALIVREINDET